jgi:hypothetical protein
MVLTGFLCTRYSSEKFVDHVEFNILCSRKEISVGFSGSLKVIFVLVDLVKLDSVKLQDFQFLFIHLNDSPDVKEAVKVEKCTIVACCLVAQS